MQISSLNPAIRSMGDPQFMGFVDHIGEDCSGNRQNLALIAATTNVDDIINFLFPPNVLKDAETCPKNVYVDEFNDKILGKLPGNFSSYFSSDSLKEAEHTLLNAPEHTRLPCNVDSSWSTSSPPGSQTELHLRHPTKLLRRKGIGQTCACA
ncbi:hypothetical protein DFJ58DRAFT_165424 [Suillus subalutaceus]|uniref:uncharacterized protein n=1 Tax=Suillus subalutaceus TaxID=48586 RepID=UPI001B87078A|nr:uncharacterized protein DFJ58DRAFT_165424 [Suillus subalutaceus]KAG1865474.1 hypothetical protein DFJ58DRAFT_165424 [Suillus subalutaceus]